MKNFTKIVFAFIFSLGFVSQSHAALLVEPVIGYSAGTFNGEFSGLLADTTKDSMKGPSYGARLGYQQLGFQLGLDYLASSLTLDGSDLKTSEFGAFVGFEFPVLFRVYAAYIFSGTGTLSSDGTDTDLKSGTGPKIGVGITLLPFIDFNIEYRTVKYEQLEIASGVDLDSDYSAIMVGFSLPFAI